MNATTNSTSTRSRIHRGIVRPFTKGPRVPPNDTPQGLNSCVKPAVIASRKAIVTCAVSALPASTTCHLRSYVGARIARVAAAARLTGRLRRPPHRAIEGPDAAAAARGAFAATHHMGPFAAEPPLAIETGRAGVVLLLSWREIARPVRLGENTAPRNRLRHSAWSGLCPAVSFSLAASTRPRSPRGGGRHREHLPSQAGEPVQAEREATQEPAVLGSAVDANAVCEPDVCGHGMLQL